MNPCIVVDKSVSMDKRSSLIDFIKEIYRIWIDEKPDQLAAALAYFGMFSFTAVIYIAFRIAGFFSNEAAAAGRFYTYIESDLGSDTANFYIVNSISHFNSRNRRVIHYSDHQLSFSPPGSDRAIPTT
jgi:uncharacterized BrkB/YihY/UPF0761 family membrane protein